VLVTERNAATCLERIDRSDDIALDTETTGLEVWTGDKMVGVAAKAGGEAMYFPFRHGEGPNLSDTRRRQLVRALSGKKLRGFHLRFDMEVMHNEGLPLPPKIEDTLIAAILMNENEPSFALKRSKRGVPGLSMKYLGADSVKADDQLHERLQAAGLGKGEMWKLPPQDVAEYACADLDLPDRLMEEVYRAPLARWKMDGLFREYNDYQRLLVEMEIGGLPMDRATIERALEEGKRALPLLQDEITKIAGYPLNPNSPKQVVAATGLPNAQAETLARSGHPLAKAIVDMRTYIKRDSAYLKRFLEWMDPQGLLHVQLNLTPNEEDLGGTRSGRLSCSHPNLQAMPKPKTSPIYAACRAALVAPPGFSILESDYMQMEVRLAGHYSQEPALFDVFRVGRDIYQEMADELGITRLDAKILFLAIQYGAGVWKIAEMLGISKDEAWQLREAWHERFPRIKNIMYRLADIAEERGAIRLWDGRCAHFDGERKQAGVCKSPYYTAWNRLIQGTGAGMVRVAMMQLWEPIRALGGRMLLQVHDSILFLIPTERLPEAARLIRFHMENFPQWDIPARVDMKAGPTWLDVQDYKEAA
jgi:DNA polymerase-1